MAKITANYEAMYILDPALSEEAIAALVAKFKAVVEANGTVSEIDEWGKRRLAYPINDLNECHYVLMTFTAAPELLGRLAHLAGLIPEPAPITAQQLIPLFSWEKLPQEDLKVEKF